MPTLDILFLILGGVLLWLGADKLVEGSSALARRWGLSELVIGLTIVALGTSLPEFLVSFTAAVKGHSSISIGNVVGSNIFNLGFILGGVACLRPITPEHHIIRRDAPLLLAYISLLLVYATVFGFIPQWGGLLLTTTFCVYIAWVLFKSRQKLATINSTLSKDPLHKNIISAPGLSQPELPLWKVTGSILFGLAALGGGSRLVVDSGAAIATWFGISQWIIGLTIIAAGTSLPELVTCLVASYRGRNQMLLGNLVGSDIFNFAGVLGITAALHPLELSSSTLPNLALSAFTVILIILMLTLRERIGRMEGILLLCFSVGRWLLDTCAIPA